MANLRDIKRRITSVSSTQKITKAMKLVSAAKFAKAQASVQAARPYAQKYKELTKKLFQIADQREIQVSKHFFEEHTFAKKDLVVVVSTDRGLCGGLNSQLFKYVEKDILSSELETTEIFAWGRKARSWARKKAKLQHAQHHEGLMDSPSMEKAKSLVSELVELYNTGQYKSISIAFNKFENALTQHPTVTKLLPFAKDEEEQSADANQIEPIFEPDLISVLEHMMLKSLSIFVYQILLEARASEHGSRMTAMDSATTNAQELKKKLTLVYNRARQAAITKELIEIISGAEAL